MATALDEAILARLESLADEYAAAMSLLTELMTGLDRLRETAARGGAGRMAPQAAPAPKPGPPAVARIRVENTDVDRLLDFQEQLSRLPGVSGVSIAGMNSANASLVVEFGER